MSDIWHITNQNRNPTDIPEGRNFIILDNSVYGNSGTWYCGRETFIDWKNVKRWCYLDDLIKENERTREALDKAKWWLNETISAAEMALNQITTLEQKDK